MQSRSTALDYDRRRREAQKARRQGGKPRQLQFSGRMVEQGHSGPVPSRFRNPHNAHDRTIFGAMSVQPQRVAQRRGSPARRAKTVSRSHRGRLQEMETTSNISRDDLATVAESLSLTGSEQKQPDTQALQKALAGSDAQLIAHAANVATRQEEGMRALKGRIAGLAQPPSPAESVTMMPAQQEESPNLEYGRKMAGFAAGAHHMTPEGRAEVGAYAATPEEEKAGKAGFAIIAPQQALTLEQLDAPARSEEEQKQAAPPTKSTAQMLQEAQERKAARDVRLAGFRRQLQFDPEDKPQHDLPETETFSDKPVSVDLGAMNIEELASDETLTRERRAWLAEQKMRPRSEREMEHLGTLWEREQIRIREMGDDWRRMTPNEKQTFLAAERLPTTPLEPVPKKPATPLAPVPMEMTKEALARVQQETALVVIPQVKETFTAPQTEETFPTTEKRRLAEQGSILGLSGGPRARRSDLRPRALSFGGETTTTATSGIYAVPFDSPRGSSRDSPRTNAVRRRIEHLEEELRIHNEKTRPDLEMEHLGTDQEREEIYRREMGDDWQRMTPNQKQEYIAAERERAKEHTEVLENDLRRSRLELEDLIDPEESKELVPMRSGAMGAEKDTGLQYDDPAQSSPHPSKIRSRLTSAPRTGGSGGPPIPNLSRLKRTPQISRSLGGQSLAAIVSRFTQDYRRLFTEIGRPK